MTGPDIIALVVAVIVEVCAAFLVTVETAISRVSRVRAEEMLDEQRRGAAALVRVASDPAPYVSSLLFLRIVLTVIPTVLVYFLLSNAGVSPGWNLLLTTVIMGAANFVLLGVGPRTLGQQHSLSLALSTAGLAGVLTRLLRPITKLLILIGNAVTPGKGFSQGPFATQAEFRELLDRAGKESVIEPDEQRMLDSVLELGDTLVRELMVPRIEMVWIERNKRLGQLMSLALRSGFSRIPVIGENLDDIVGVVHVKDVMGRIYEDDKAEERETVAKVMRPAMLVPDSKRADDLLREFQASRTHLAILVDEYGGTAGLVTVEDILEEIVGEITDEYDAAEIAAFETLGPRDFRVSARLPIDDLAEYAEMDISMEAEGVETVGGLLARRLGLVPIPGSQVEVDGYLLTAESAEGRRNRVSTVRVTGRGAGGNVGGGHDSGRHDSGGHNSGGHDGHGQGTHAPDNNEQGNQQKA